MWSLLGGGHKEEVTHTGKVQKEDSAELWKCHSFSMDVSEAGWGDGHSREGTRPPAPGHGY